MLASSKPAQASCSQVAAGGDRWLLMGVRGHLGDTDPVMRRPGSQWDGVIERLSASRKCGRSVPGTVVSAAPLPDSGAGRRHHGKSGTRRRRDLGKLALPGHVANLGDGSPAVGHPPPASQQRDHHQHRDRPQNQEGIQNDQDQDRMTVQQRDHLLRTAHRRRGPEY